MILDRGRRTWLQKRRPTLIAEPQDIAIRPSVSIPTHGRSESLDLSLPCRFPTAGINCQRQNQRQNRHGTDGNVYFHPSFNPDVPSGELTSLIRKRNAGSDVSGPPSSLSARSFTLPQARPQRTFHTSEHPSVAVTAFSPRGVDQPVHLCTGDLLCAR